MLHLARVTNKDPDGKARLQLLAQQKAEYAWALLPDDDGHLWFNADDYSEGMLVLLELSPTKQIQQVHDIQPWLLEILGTYLSIGVTPAVLQEEMQRAEQWRQSLTLQSQELGRRALEMEARRDQIQELEENLKQEKQKLEQMAAELEMRCHPIQEQESPLPQD